eukprot:CAMPEP_0197240176 /NCGR_PEP_ID=MMETSP1429-20130617/6513_1 /TAXON_ID=49237 /ORGANISM="Chaetoceros  sp., Strain UNC1202" /LENGTH=51 /DNA_ID=CAMNT_0042699761 /DNA_START=46 /DNA_END=198 /DNA_ORIENTATION=+
MVDHIGGELVDLASDAVLGMNIILDAMTIDTDELDSMMKHIANASDELRGW